MPKRLYILIPFLTLAVFCFYFFYFLKPAETQIIEIPVIEKTTQARSVEITVLALGDMMFGRRVGKDILKGTDPFEFIRFDGGNFEAMSGDKSDIVIGNLEGPITSTKVCQDKPYSFRFATNMAILLRDRGITNVSLGNNHSFDCFQTGLDDTRKYLAQAGIKFAGGGKNILKSYYIENVKGKKLAFISIDLTISPPPIPLEKLYDLVKSLKSGIDMTATTTTMTASSTLAHYVFVSIHWGEEYRKTATEGQIEIAHTLIDSGADAIFGHHPHVTEQIESYKGKTIFYSLGNFIFDQIGKEQNESFIAELKVTEGESGQSYKTFPFTINSSQPKLNELR
ncbi:MAG: CapA family protein [bacterium]